MSRHKCILMFLVSLGSLSLLEQVSADQTITSNLLGASTVFPAPPQWVAKMALVPGWWPDVKVDYAESSAFPDKLARMKTMEGKIKNEIGKGNSPVNERRELIKYLYLWCASPNLKAGDRSILKSKIAQAYERLGEYKWAAREYVEIIDEHSEDMDFYSLAIQYERLGDKESALQIYNYMAETFKNGTTGSRIAAIGITCLNGHTNNCNLRKPDWWDLYESSPSWWANSTVVLPKFSSFDDGRDFIEQNISQNEDPKYLIKAWISMLSFSDITFEEKIQALLSIRYAYSKIGDHHRAIEFAWQIPEQFSGDTESTKIALKVIASEFEDLTETNHAQEIRSLIPCFAKETSGT